ncbi:MAG: DNA recombination protein RmuC [Epsilonproteobacteria bacterium]|nr:MAG: DNA recombination protein RmuC [Campylobacterota bacterium]RLA66209.1 MAG: DNA recombination protein RmuC [Campylobacterota bacterium]
MEHLYLYPLLAFFFGLILGWLFFRRDKKLEIEFLKTQVKLQEIEEENKKLNIEFSASQERSQQLFGQKEELAGKVDGLTTVNQKLKEEQATLVARKDAFEERIKDQKNDLERVKLDMTNHFKNLAQGILEEKSNSFKETSTEHISHLINPFGKELKEFKEKIEKTYDQERSERISLKTEIENFVKINEGLTRETDRLTNALKGDVKAQGKWGEFVLENILQASGLRKNHEYIAEGEGLRLKGEDGNNVRPDFVLLLPDNKHIIIDSKVSLSHYERFIAGEDEEKNLKLFDHSINEHIKNLSSKKYHLNEKLISPDFTFLFMPIEGAFSLAIENNGDLFKTAWEKNVVLVGPTNLMASLRTVASIWKIEKQNKNSMEIAVLGGKLHDKMVGFIEDMNKIGDGLQNTEKNFDKAMKKLSLGRGNMLSMAHKMNELGAKTHKKIPENLLD